MGIGKISEFDIDSGNWDVYCERLEMYFKVNEIKDDVKVPTLITVVGDKCYELMVNLASPKKPSDYTFTALVELVKSHLNPKPSILAERYRFRLRRQNNGESILQYVAELKKLSRLCEFKANLDENLRDQFVCGVSSDIIRQRLFTKDEITFANALRLACSLEAAEKNAAAVEQGNSGAAAGSTEASAGAAASEVHALGAARGRYRPGAGGTRAAGPSAGRNGEEQQRSAVICDACGAHGHTREGCRFKHFECSKCRKTGHLRRVCPGKQNRTTNFGQKRNDITKRNIHYNETKEASGNDESEDSFEVEEFHQLSLNGYKPIFDNHFHFHHHSVAKRSLAPAHDHHGRLEGDQRVHWAKQQRILSRKKRDFIPLHDSSSTAETIPSDVPFPSSAAKRDTGSKREYQMPQSKRSRMADTKFQLNDPKWPHMWYLNRGGGLDMNVIPAWREGITGRGVVVTILDDGLETDHPDLVSNYDPMASYDVNAHDSDPQPRYDMIDSNRHGTRCAGEVAATANNSLCAVGVAFGASVGGVRMLDGDVTDAVEARSLSLNPQHVDIYSASWGPDDDGKTVDGPGELATRAFIEGVTKGRNGKGSIFVWASGNGGREHDNCNCDGYTNSIWTLSISSATERGEVPWYSEMCSSTLAATYSSGTINEKQVITTDLHHSCTAGHTGTSASAPLAAGICALALQANRDLTWRDMQHIVVRTARPERLSLGGEWRVNGVGRNVSHSFGYGLLDASGMVRLAKTWRRVPPQRRCELAAPRIQRSVPSRSTISLQLDVASCPGVNYLEHVQARVTLSAQRRGDLRITLTSPAGTNVTLLAPRAHDSSRAGFTAWPFMSVHMWGESPLGVWQLEVSNEGRYQGRATLQDWSLTLYGTSTPAAKNDPIPFRNPVRNKGNATRPVMVQSGRKNKGKAVSIVPTYTVGLVKRKKNKNSKNQNRNSQKPKQGRPATRSPIDSTSTTTTASTPDLSLNLRGDLTDPLSDARGRKMSNLFEQYPKIQRIYPAPLRANEAGPLSQWELIFYGTETPPQESDTSSEANPLGTNPLGPNPLGTNPVAPVTSWKGNHNDIDEDVPLTWQNSNAVDDDSPETPPRSPVEAAPGGQKFIGSNTNSGCTTFNPQPINHCIECAKGLHLYDGRCFDRCPDDTYASELLTERSSRRHNLNYFSEGGNVSTTKRQNTDRNPTASEALDMEPEANIAKSPLTCYPCHYSCATCDGPHDNQCLSCSEDAQLYNSSDVEVSTYCYSHSVLSKLSDAHWHSRLNVILSIVLFTLSFISLYFLIAFIIKKCGFFCCGSHYNSNINIAYNKLADDDKNQTALEIEDEIKKALNDFSDSESEDDLNL